MQDADQGERKCGFRCESERILKRNLFGAHISGFPLEAKAVSMNGIRCAKEKGRMIAARPTRCTTLAGVVVIYTDRAVWFSQEGGGTHSPPTAPGAKQSFALSLPAADIRRA